MTTQIQGFIDHFALSDNLTNAQIAAFLADTTPTITTSSAANSNKAAATFGSTQVDMWDIPNDVKSFDEGVTFDEIDRTSVNSKVKKYRRGRADWEITCVMYESEGDGTNTKYSGDLISSQVNADTDVRALYVKREQASQELWALVTITEASSSTGEDSDLTKTIKFRVASGATVPVWK